MPAWLITVTAPDGFGKDGPVTVTWDRATGRITRDASGAVAQQDMTYQVDPDPRSHNELKGSVKNGVVTVEPADFRMVLDPYLQPEIKFQQTHMRLTMNADGTARGVIAGYQPWSTVYYGFADQGAHQGICRVDQFAGALLRAEAGSRFRSRSEDRGKPADLQRLYDRGGSRLRRAGRRQQDRAGGRSDRSESPVTMKHLKKTLATAAVRADCRLWRRRIAGGRRQAGGWRRGHTASQPAAISSDRLRHLRPDDQGRRAGSSRDIRRDGLLAMGASQVSVTASGLEEYDKIARNVAAQVVGEANRDTLIPCKPANTKAADDACATQFLSETGRMLYRRPLTKDELASV